MYDIEALMAGFKEMRKMSSGAMSLGKLREKLSAFDGNTEVVTSNGVTIYQEYFSYRGYYEDLSFSPEADLTPKPVSTVKDFIDIIDEALADGLMCGYKGGDFVIDNSTLAWVSPYGSGGGDQIVEVLDINDQCYIVLKPEEN
jgi:hypothetical protein